MNIDAEIQKRKRADRAGTHHADGFKWCPKCGSEVVPSGHSDCSACRPSTLMTDDELKEVIHRAHEADKARMAKARGGKSSKKGAETEDVQTIPTNEGGNDGGKTKTAKKS